MSLVQEQTLVEAIELPMLYRLPRGGGGQPCRRYDLSIRSCLLRKRA
ncbi:hypothetical protein [Bradyrhizobium sp. CB3481]|nr:hypothetical protein [Bradyrhizobium sp. CB3481]WFU19909.1 hypothetical protein QA643_17040 [Bradyrhizobium sp. CB3481]